MAFVFLNCSSPTRKQPPADNKDNDCTRLNWPWPGLLGARRETKAPPLLSSILIVSYSPCGASSKRLSLSESDGFIWHTLRSSSRAGA
ncbi:hypothetical protein EYF80_005934 [Liparis tanakae]|uniref:Uncharacterized protein n=1 Tax=Liparis tanakae TaxID=230148 RepID=A0A4Z2J225_9TELE|nr:hypothetical protein EYF80_005934 [Liparis tanakae]